MTTLRVRPRIVAALAVAVASASVADAQQYVYPEHGQSHAKQHKDEVHCSNWAKSQSGYDPANPPVVAKAEPAPVTGSNARVRGAAGGAIGGAIMGNAAAGAAVGAVAGGLVRRVRNNNAAEAQNQANAQRVANMKSSYYRARSACLTGRGYSVK
ncbi:MAG: hypothetical protein JO111_01940 [Caulobacteraceae bacterium]|nr:hypothetical protein [Caulobacteraceae bacterium]